jgi:hypothetical protein
MLAGVAKVLMTTHPTQTSVLESLEECRSLGDEAFLAKYASGHQPLGHYLIHEDRRYPMKAVWAAAHRPTIQTRDFKTGAARRQNFSPIKIQDEALPRSGRASPHDSTQLSAVNPIC